MARLTFAYGMKSDAASRFMASRGTLLSIIALTLVLFTITNLPWQLDEYDQAKQAFTSFEMVQQNHWIYQHTPNGWVATKPPLVGWVSAGLFAITRSWELAWRLPSLFAAIALGALIWRAALRAFGKSAALIAACAFALNLFTPRLATLVRTDMPLALVLFLIGAQIWNKIRTRKPWDAADRWLIFALLTAAMLIKGPIVYVFLLPGILAYEWRRTSAHDTASAWCGWWPWLGSLAVFLAWVIGGILLVPEFSEHVVIREFAGRFSEAIHRSQPLYFYIVQLLYRFAPWSIMLSVLAILAARKTYANFRGWFRNVSPEIFWLIAWSVGGLVVMSLIPSKRVDRIFPVLPPLCLLLAAQIAAFRKDPDRRHTSARLSASARIVASLVAAGYAIARVIPGYRQHRDAFAVFGRQVRQEAAARHSRYQVVGGEDEGMALYLRRTEFIEPEQAVRLWNDGEVDALIVPDDELDGLRPRLRDAVPSRLGISEPAGNDGRRYVFLVRSPAE
ncbi:MAG: ArnT family glycosyltransferase [Chthoniobacterales bacterium]